MESSLLGEGARRRLFRERGEAVSLPGLAGALAISSTLPESTRLAVSSAFICDINCSNISSVEALGFVGGGFDEVDALAGTGGDPSWGDAPPPRVGRPPSCFAAGDDAAETGLQLELPSLST
jgi:hypothetical protein